MTIVVRVAALVMASIATAGSVAAQTTAGSANGGDWSVSASAFTYLVPEGGSYVQPTIIGDREWLHLEARFNYEDRDTGSAWFGRNFSVGQRVTLDITPMVGAVFGSTDRIAPGVEASLGWQTLTLDTEAEYVIDTADSADSFFYTWSELALAPKDWYRFGLVVQRTKVFETDFDIQRGLFAGFSYKRVSVTAYFFNPDADEPSGVIGVSLDF
jgi:hypothetical protein